MMAKWKRFLTWLDKKFDGKKMFIVRASALLSNETIVQIDIRTTGGYFIKNATLVGVTMRYIAFTEHGKESIDRMHFNFIKSITIVETIEKDTSNTLSV